MGLTYFITGATRGIGLEFVRQLSESGENTVIGSARSIENAGKLKELSESRKNVHIVELVVGDEASTAKLGEQLAKIDSGIDVYINNAGVATVEGANVVANTGRKIWLDHYMVNVIGAIEVYQQVLPFLRKKNTRKIGFISSVGGSVSEFIPFPLTAYGQSKAALNFTVRHIAAELKDEGFTVVALHPGLVDTDMGRSGLKSMENYLPKEMLEEFEKDILTPEQSVRNLTKVVSELKVDDTGKFFYEDGTVHDF